MFFIEYLNLVCSIVDNSLNSVKTNIGRTFLKLSKKLGVTVNHVLVSLASPFYDLALHLCVLSIYIYILLHVIMLMINRKIYVYVLMYSQ